MLQYEKIMNQLIWEIKANKYPVGSRLPCERELALRFNTSQKTIHNAVAKLESRGFIESRHGSGNYIKTIHPEHFRERIAIIMNCSHNKSSDDFLMTQSFMDMIGSINAYIRPRGGVAELMIYQDDEPVAGKMPELISGGYFLNLFFTATGELAKVLHDNGGILLSTITTFHEKRFLAEYPEMPYVLYDFRFALQKAFEFYKGQGVEKFAYFSQGKMGEPNYDIFAEIAANCGVELEKYHYNLRNVKETEIYSGKRVDFFRKALIKLPDNSVIFSDGIRHITELLHDFSDWNDLDRKYTFCLTGGSKYDTYPESVWYVDRIPFSGENVAIYAAKTLLDYIVEGKNIPLKQSFDAEFICDERRNIPIKQEDKNKKGDTTSDNLNYQEGKKRNFILENININNLN